MTEDKKMGIDAAPPKTDLAEAAQGVAVAAPPPAEAAKAGAPTAPAAAAEKAPVAAPAATGDKK